MTSKFENYYAKLEALTDAELHRSAEKLVARENTNIAKLIAHLAEMSECKTVLRMGCQSLYVSAVDSKGALAERRTSCRFFASND